jgi:hypothetical protein
MTLNDAIELLCRIHIRDDKLTDFVVEIGAAPSTKYEHDHYVEAWRAMFEARAKYRGLVIAAMP